MTVHYWDALPRLIVHKLKNDPQYIYLFSDLNRKMSKLNLINGLNESPTVLFIEKIIHKLDLDDIVPLCTPLLTKK